MQINELFPLGQIVATSNALKLLSMEEIRGALTLHGIRDWGNVSEADKGLNDDAVLNGGRILSAYDTEDGVTFWIITEADRSATTILLPSDY